MRDTVMSKRDKLQKSLVPEANRIFENLRALAHDLKNCTFVDAFTINEMIDDAIDGLKEMKKTADEMEKLEEKGEF